MRLTLILLFLNALCAGYLVYSNRESASRADETRILSLDTKEVTALDIFVTGQGPLSLAKRGADWWITAPVEWPANPFAVQRILNQIVFAHRDVTFKVDEKDLHFLENYGLLNPAIVFKLRGPQGEEVLKIGAPTSVGNKLYALGPDNKTIAVIPKDGFDTLAIAPEQLQSERVFDLPIYAIESILIKQREPELTLRLTRQGEQWIFESPITAAADTAAVQTFLDNLTRLSVTRFVEPNSGSSASLDTPEVRVTLRGKNRHQTLLIESQSANVALARLESSPTLFTVSLEPFTHLRDRWESLRDHRILKTDTSKITAFDIARDGKKISLQKLETGPWQIIGEKLKGELETIPAEAQTIATTLKALSSLQAVAFVSDAPSQRDLQAFELDPPQGEITLRTTPKPTTLYIGGQGPEGKYRYVRTSESPSVYGVSNTHLNAFVSGAYAYRTRSLLTLPETASFKSLKLVRLLDHATLIECDAQNPRLSFDIKNALKPLSAETFLPLAATQSGVQVAANKTELPWRYELTITYELPSSSATQEKAYTFRLTEAQPKTPMLCAASDSASVFTLPAALHELLSKAAAEPVK